ncbi:MCE family protein [Mycolicibacterium palauense]|uniref:MCE family protein n=1 Tax=Mycolicibacterium palauense TaxID=2034511 RepID=UPI000BFEC26C
MRTRKLRTAVILALSVILTAAVITEVRISDALDRIHIVAYFDNSNGLYQNDEVRILGVPVGRISDIEAQPQRVKITFWVDGKYRVPADAKAAIVAPQLVTSRAIQLTPAYTGGPAMQDGAVIPENRTAVPLEWDDLRQQLEKLTDALQPTRPGGVSTLGAFVNTAADNLRGQGANIRDTVIAMSQAFSALGDHSADTFSTIKNLSVVVSALEDSSDLLGQFNDYLAAVTGALVTSPDAVGTAVKNINDVVGETTDFITDNRETLGATTDELASLTSTVRDSLDDVEQALHLFPSTLQNFINIYQPTQQGITGALTMQNFANPISFLCGGIQAASRLNAEQSAKLCVQYLAPIIKNRQYNFPPLGSNYVVGQAARPNELTYSEDRLRPDHVPTPTPAVDAGTSAPAEAQLDATPVPTDPAAGLPGMMIPPGGGS